MTVEPRPVTLAQARRIAIAAQGFLDPRPEPFGATMRHVQRVIDHAGCDVRASVVGDRVIAAIERRARDGGWRTNISLGGDARSVDLSPAWSELALTAARAVGADYVGGDLLPATDGTVHVLEVNGIPGWSGVQRATSVDVAGAIVGHLIASLCT